MTSPCLQPVRRLGTLSIYQNVFVINQTLQARATPIFDLSSKESIESGIDVCFNHCEGDDFVIHNKGLLDIRDLHLVVDFFRLTRKSEEPTPKTEDLSSVLLLKFLHERNQSFNTFTRKGVIDRGSNTSNRTMSL